MSGRQPKEQAMTNDRYAQWRDNGCPCGTVACFHHAPGDPDAQCCCGLDHLGGPELPKCRAYVPDPFAVLEMSKPTPGKVAWE